MITDQMPPWNGEKYQGTLSSSLIFLIDPLNYIIFHGRWIKYEQTVDHETNMWSKPFVGALVYQSLLYLKTGLQYGLILFIL
jgi:hypothetical protein